MTFYRYFVIFNHCWTILLRCSMSFSRCGVILPSYRAFFPFLARFFPPLAAVFLLTGYCKRRKNSRAGRICLYASSLSLARPSGINFIIRFHNTKKVFDIFYGGGYSSNRIYKAVLLMLVINCGCLTFWGNWMRIQCQEVDKATTVARRCRKATGLQYGRQPGCLLHIPGRGIL